MPLINIVPTQVGLIVRGKINDSHSPSVMAQHADCILSTGAPIGFFGDGARGAASSGPSSGSSMKIGLNMRGVVYDYGLMETNRPYYITAGVARTYNIASTVLLLDVPREKAVRFDEAWAVTIKTPGAFYLLGKNCSTYAAKAFRTSGIIKSGISGIDTPNNLYIQLKKQYPTGHKVYSGFIGFVKNGGKYDMEVIPA